MKSIQVSRRLDRLFANGFLAASSVAKVVLAGRNLGEGRMILESMQAITQESGWKGETAMQRRLLHTALLAGVVCLALEAKAGTIIQQEEIG